MNEKAKQRALVNFITKHYSSSQINELYFSTGIDIEDVGVGQAGKSAKARELVLYAARRSEEFAPGQHRSFMYPLLEAIDNDETISTDLSQFAWQEWPYPGNPLETTPDSSFVETGAGMGETAVSPDTAPSDSTQSDYLNFDITIAAKRGAKYPVSASSIVGDTEQPILQRFPPKDAKFTDTLYYLRELMASKQDTEQLGRTLQSFLFPKEIQSLFDRALARAKSEGKKGVRIRLKITNDIPEIARIPWEYCWDRRSFMALDEATPIVRYLPMGVDVQSTHMPEKVRILLATASPKNYTSLNLEAQENQIKEALSRLERSGKVELRVLPHVTRGELRRNFRRFDPHILHFVGHGMLEENEGMLLLEDDEGNGSKVSAEDMYVLARSSGVKLVVLSACETAAQNEASSEAIMGIAPMLVAAGVPAVIAMQFEIPEKTAVSFTRDLYQFLADGEPLDTAITEARIGVYFDNDDKIFWAIPVLFMRSPNGRIW